MKFTKPVLFAVAATAVAAATAWLVDGRQQPAPAHTAAAPAPQAPLPAPLPVMTLDNATTITAVKDDRRTRDFSFKDFKSSFKAEGVELDGAGQLTLESQGTGGKLKQRVDAVRLVRDDGTVVRELTRNAKPAAEASITAQRGSLLYQGLFDGVDVEYRYDGKDVEEFFHLSAALKAEIAKEHASVEFVSLFMGLTPKNTLLEGPGMPPPGMDKLPPGVKAPTLRDRIDMLVDGRHRYQLPPSVAYDEGAHKHSLTRRTAYTPNGLMVASALSYDWVERAQGQVVVDPSIIDGPRQIQLNTWTGARAVVKDDQGKLHIAWMGVYNGCWTAMYANGDGNIWSTPIPIATHTSGECTHYQPSIAIDSKGTLHVMYADWGSGDAVNRGIADGRHRVKYAYCLDRCRSGVWQGQQFLYAAAGGHQYDYHIAVGGADLVAATFYDEGTSGMRFMTNDGTGWVNQGIVMSDASYGQIVADSAGKLHLIAMPWWGGGPTETRVRHIAYNPGAGWTSFPSVNAGQLNPYIGQYYLSAATDNQDNIHITVGIYDYNVGYYRAGYARWDPTAATWNNQGLPEGGAPYDYSEDWSSIAVDDARTAHLVVQKNSTPPRVAYTQKPFGAAWTASKFLMPNGPGQVSPHLRTPTRVPAFSRTMTAGLLDMVYVEDFTTLRYFSTGAPVESPTLTLPADHSYQNTTKPAFSWRKIASDNGTNTTYILEIATSPLFAAADMKVTKSLATNTYTLSGVAPELLANGTYYYWRVKASNTYGAGPYSMIFELGVDTVAPSAFDLTAPADNSDPGTKTPTFTWTQSVN